MNLHKVLFKDLESKKKADQAICLINLYPVFTIF